VIGGLFLCGSDLVGQRESPEAHVEITLSMEKCGVVFIDEDLMFVKDGMTASITKFSYGYQGTAVGEAKKDDMGITGG
jgi:hypothetical protein